MSISQEQCLQQDPSLIGDGYGRDLGISSSILTDRGVRVTLLAHPRDKMQKSFCIS